MSTPSSALLNQVFAKKHQDPRKVMYGLNIANQPVVHNANHYINRLLNETAPPAFQSIPKIDIVNGIRDALAHTYNNIANQRDSSLCGPASFFVSILRQRPWLYAKAVTELYSYGITKIGNLVIIPSDATRNFRPKPPTPLTNPIRGTDWVLLASLRDSENTNFRYDSPSDKIAGITMPANMIKWFKQAGATNIAHDYGIVFPRDFSNLAKANDYYSNGFSVCLFINMTMIANVITFPSPNHWILLTSTITSGGNYLTPAIAKQLENDRIMADMSAGEQDSDFEYDLNFDVYTWGNEYRSVTHTKSDTKDIMNFYYGFVAAKW